MSVICISHRRIAWLLGILLLVPLLLLTTAPWWMRGIGNWLAVVPQPGSADAIVMLSGGKDRLLHGIELYKAGRAPALWYVGSDPLADVPGFAEGQFFRQIAVAEGVSEDTIRLLPSTSTWEDALAIRMQTQQERIDTILLVTDWYHSRRALCVVRHQLADMGVTVYYEPPPGTAYGPENWWRNEEGLVGVTNELLKFGFYWRQYGLAPWRC